MYEYTFTTDGSMTFGTTYDFLEVCCQITRNFDSKVTGEFIAALQSDKVAELDFLRIVEWTFEFVMSSIEGEQTIKLHKSV